MDSSMDRKALLRDERNKRIIALTSWAPRYEREILLEGGSPEEREAFVRKHRNLFFGGVASILVITLLLELVPRDAPPAPPSPEIVEAGRVEGLRLHETAFSTSTTVTTSTGTYQVRGGVSAAEGDIATLKRESHPAPRTSLCIESSIKPACYALL